MHRNASIQWDRPHPYTLPITVQPAHIDRLGHTNNTTYLNWMEDVSWAHIEPLGMGWEVQERLGKGMAIMRTEIDYLASSYVGDALVIGTWITASDGRLYSARQFQIVRPADGKTIIRASSRYACIDLKTGKPSRMPKEFAEAHRRAMEGHGG